MNMDVVVVCNATVRADWSAEVLNPQYQSHTLSSKGWAQSLADCTPPPTRPPSPPLQP